MFPAGKFYQEIVQVIKARGSNLWDTARAHLTFQAVFVCLASCSCKNSEHVTEAEQAFSRGRLALACHKAWHFPACVLFWNVVPVIEAGASTLQGKTDTSVLYGLAHFRRQRIFSSANMNIKLSPADVICCDSLQVIEAGASILQGETGIGVPHGLARFCSGPTWAEAALTASLFKAGISR